MTPTATGTAEATEFSRIAILGDRETVEGLEIAGLVDGPADPTVILIERAEETESVARKFSQVSARRDVGIIFLCDFVAEKIPRELERQKGALPSVLVIPTKERLSG